ncbi:MAG: hypothetical protein FWF75_09165, partial [Propionibacteriaceae bacterium]|nr:hypothetical protein [Propionibacteriaceae bacterium]
MPAPAQPVAQTRGTGEAYPSGPYAAALLGDDPPKIGSFWLDGRLAARASGIAYLAHGADQTPVMLVMLAEGAADDAAARDRLAGEVNKMAADTVIARGGANQNEGRLADKFSSEDADPIAPTDAPMAPWVALAYDGTMDAVAEADRLLRSVDLSRTPALGAVAGPDFRLPWIAKTSPGRWRSWPLPWPGRRDRTGWLSILVSFLLMIALAALALLIVVLIFQNPPPPSSSTSPNGGSSQSSSPSPGSPSSPESGSPSSGSPSSGSPSSSSPSSGSPSSGSPSSASATPTSAPPSSASPNTGSPL